MLFMYRESYVYIYNIYEYVYMHMFIYNSHIFNTFIYLHKYKCYII